MVHLGLIKGKSRRVVDVDKLFAERIGVVAPPSLQSEARLGGRGFNGWIDGMQGTSRQTNQAAVFATTVIGINAV